MTVIRRRLPEQIVADLRAALILGEIRSGTHLAEDELASRYDVSRGPVREALLLLDGDGLVESRRGRYYARGLHVEDIDDLYDLRTTIETHAVARAVSRPAAEVEKAFGPSLADMAAAVAAGDVERMAVADLDFHSTVYRLAGNRLAFDTWQRLAPTFHVLFRLSNSPRPASAIADHEHIRTLIAGDDPLAAVEELREHLDRSAEIVRPAVHLLHASGAPV